MVHASPQFTPTQLLDSGRRAETEGTLDLAVQFYRHLTDHHAYTAEAAEARNGLGRVGAAQSQVWQPQNGSYVNGNGNGAHAAPVEQAQHRAARPARTTRRRPVAPRDHYRAGRAMARFFSGIGWLTMAAGASAPLLYLLPDTPLRVLGLPLVVAGAVGIVLTGLLIVFSGQIARAIFDQANATRDIAALERAKLLAE
jgi:hypothetical protein